MILLDEIYQGDVIDILKTIPDNFVHCVVTSPPYWAQRDYGVPPRIWGDTDCDHEFGDPIKVVKGGPQGSSKDTAGRSANKARAKMEEYEAGQSCRCGAWYGCLGLEPTPEMYVANIVEVFRDVRRVLRDDGTMWFNIGDSYNRQDGTQNLHMSVASTRGGGKKAGSVSYKLSQPKPSNIKEKELVGIPWMTAFALRADGWYLRSEIIWHKKNPQPESVRDRPTKSHEQIFLLTKKPHYYYDAEAIKEPCSEYTNPRGHGLNPKAKLRSGTNSRLRTRQNASFTQAISTGIMAMRNSRTVWSVGSRPYKGAHFAVFPPEIPERCIKAGTCEAGVCWSCGTPRKRIVEKVTMVDSGSARAGNKVKGKGLPADKVRKGRDLRDGPIVLTKTRGWETLCKCEVENVRPVVLDPFTGSGTTCAVAAELGRSFIGIELNKEYCKLARKRLEGVQRRFT